MSRFRAGAILKALLRGLAGGAFTRPQNGSYVGPEERVQETRSQEGSTEPRHGSYLGLGVAGFHRLHYCEWGRHGNPRLVVCVHGYSRNARDFDFLARALREDYRVVCPDLAGRGDSDWLATPIEYNFPQFMADLNALLARLDIDEVDWIGTSMGGLLGMLIAAQPNTPIRRLVMNDVGAFVPAGSLLDIGHHLPVAARFGSLDELEQHLRHTHKEFGFLTDEQWRHLAVHSARAEGQEYRLHYDPGIALLLRQMPLAPGLFLWDVWSKLACPVLLVRGEHSKLFPQPVADVMLSQHPQARLVTVPDTGHAPPLMSPGEIDVIWRFLGEGQETFLENRDWRLAAGASPRNAML